jgi:hypothetical protein
MKKIVLPLLAVLFSINLVLAQDIFYIDQHDSIMTSNGILYDSGGPDGDYSAGENVSCLIYAVPGSELTLYFEEFELEGMYDELTIQEGENFSDPVLMQASGDDLLGQTITLENGALLFSFSSDGSVNYPGFKVIISTVPVSQDFNINWLAQDDFDFNSIMHFCEADTINFRVEPTFYQNHMVYYQTADSLSYEWSVFRNGSSVFYQSAFGLDSLTFAFDEQGLYQVNLIATDQNGVQAMNHLTSYFSYGPEPDFSAVNYPDTVCQGALFEFMINQEAFAPTFNSNLGSSPIETTYIPDGSGAEYVIDVPVIASQVAQITTANDVEAVCINLEHSYMGDLDIWLECPNGQTNLLFEQACGAGWFGEAIDDEALTIGNGYDYCWTINADSSMSDMCPPGGESLPQGDYLPVESFGSFIGCPVGGIWKLHILDNLAIDNGYVFDFYIHFSEHLTGYASSDFYSNLDYSASPDNPTFSWEGNQVVDVQGGNAQVLASESGLQSYHFTVENGGGCVYETDYQVFILPESDADCCVNVFAGIDEIVCGTQFDLHAQTNADSLYWSVLSGAGNASFADSTEANTLFEVDTVGLFTLVCHAFNTNEGCHVSDTLVLEFVDEQIDPMFNLIATDVELRADFVYSGELNELATYNWIVPEAETIVGYGNGPVIAYFPEPGVYEVGLSVEYGCVSDTNYVSFELLDFDEPEYVVTNPTCAGLNNGSILVQHDDIDEVYVDNMLRDTLIINLAAGMYNLNVSTNSGYMFHDSIELINPEPTYGEILSQNDFLFCGDSILVELSDEFSLYAWGNSTIGTPPVFYETMETWVSARDSLMCLHIDSINILIDNYTVQPVLAGYTEDEAFLSSWSASENIAADSLDLFVWNETAPPLMIAKTAIADSAWVGEIDDYNAQYFYVQHENICLDTLTSDLINVLSLIDGGGKSSELPLYWQVTGDEYFENEISILSDELPFDEYVLYDTHPIDDSPYIMSLPEQSVRIKLRAGLLNAITFNGNTYNHLYSDVLFHQAEMLEDFNNASIFVYPNPFSDELIYGFSEAINEPVRVTLTDAVGKVVFSENHASIQSGESIRIDTKSLNAGLYLLQIQSESRFDRIKLMKQ